MLPPTQTQGTKLMLNAEVTSILKLEKWNFQPQDNKPYQHYSYSTSPQHPQLYQYNRQPYQYDR